jgi:glycosyltransferase involved in cell wall biosynthesis
VIDLVAPQSPSYRERGIARHGLDFTQAVVEGYPDLVDRVLVHPELPPVGGLDRLIASGKVATSLDGQPPGGIFHVTSAFEPEIPVQQLWPRPVSARRMRLVVTLYDLIPDVYPEMYLVDPGLRRRWRACRELVRVADHVLTLSHSGTDDVVRLLGVPRNRVTVIGAGCDDRFHRAESQGAALAEARRVVEGLGDHFVVYNGAIDPRKNLDRLVEAYARLPEVVRAQWQLVVVCRADPLQRNHYLVMAERLGVAGRVLFPGFVPDRTLVDLYQSTDLMVFPSLYEGYGLPVIEAQACGAPVIAADNSSLRELVDPDARFDGLDVEAISRAIHQGLTDDAFRQRLLRRAALPAPQWSEVASSAAAVYQELLDRDVHGPDHRHRIIPGWRTRPMVAVVSPDTTFGRRLADALHRAGADVDRYVGDEDRRRGAGPGSTPPAADPVSGERHDIGAFRQLDHWRGGYDLVVCCVGDGPSHREAVTLLHGPGLGEARTVVLAHDVSLRQAYEAAGRADLLPGGLASTLQEIYPGLPADVGVSGELPEPVAERHGLLLARHAISASSHYVVADETAARRVRLDARPEHAARVEVSEHLRGTDEDVSALAESLLASVRRELSDWAGTR